MRWLALAAVALVAVLYRRVAQWDAAQEELDNRKARWGEDAP